MVLSGTKETDCKSCKKCLNSDKYIISLLKCVKNETIVARIC